jgi:hypothetical protein
MNFLIANIQTVLIIHRDIIKLRNIKTPIPEEKLVFINIKYPLKILEI